METWAMYMNHIWIKFQKCNLIELYLNKKMAVYLYCKFVFKDKKGNVFMSCA